MIRYCMKLLIVSRRRNELLLTHNLHQQRPVSALINRNTKRLMVTTAKKSSKPDLISQPNKIQAIQSRALMETTSKVSNSYDKISAFVK